MNHAVFDQELGCFRSGSLLWYPEGEYWFDPEDHSGPYYQPREIHDPRFSNWFWREGVKILERNTGKRPERPPPRVYHEHEKQERPAGLVNRLQSFFSGRL